MRFSLVSCFALALVSLAATHSAHAASFDCKLAHSPREKAVCANPKLSALDSQVGVAYKSVRSQVSAPSADLIQIDQREWLHFLDAVCPVGNKAQGKIGDCLMDFYNTRLQQLGTQAVSGAVFYTRAHFVVVHATSAPDADAASMDPGFGYGEFAWPQIDNPTPPQAKWNDAAKKFADQAIGASSDKKPATLDAAVDTAGYIQSFFTIAAVNSRFIGMDFGLVEFGWGAAHPSTGISSLLWWLDPGRSVTPQDIFRAGADWQHALIQPTIAKLSVDPGKDSIWDGDELNKGVTSGINDIGNWEISSKGLQISFSQYQVAAYAMGMPSVLFHWNELTPLLNAALQPQTLPAPLPQPAQ